MAKKKPTKKAAPKRKPRAAKPATAANRKPQPPPKVTLKAAGKRKPANKPKTHPTKKKAASRPPATKNNKKKRESISRAELKAARDFAIQEQELINQERQAAAEYEKRAQAARLLLADMEASRLKAKGTIYDGNYNKLYKKAESGDESIFQNSEPFWMLEYNIKTDLRAGEFRYIFLGGQRFPITKNNKDELITKIGEYIEAITPKDDKGQPDSSFELNYFIDTERQIMYL